MKKQDKVGEAMLRYIYFYLAVIFVLGVLSSAFDLLYFKRTYGSTPSSGQNPIGYFVFYGLIGWPIIPVSILYNYVINNAVFSTLLFRMSTAVFSMLVAALLIHPRLEFGYYIGHDRWVKNFIVFFLAGVVIELIRLIVIKIRYAPEGRQRKRAGRPAH